MPTFLLSLSKAQHRALIAALRNQHDQACDMLEEADPRDGIAQLGYLNLQRLDSVLLQLTAPPVPIPLPLEEEEKAALTATCQAIAEADDAKSQNDLIDHLTVWLISRAGQECQPRLDGLDDLRRARNPREPHAQRPRP